MISVNVHIGAETPLQTHRTSAGDRVWLEIGRSDGSVALFLDRDGLARVVDALHAANDLRTAA
ncbi:hypothetical protein GCM10010399_17100 [Dactylosporangium fulvum]|uniref:Uncharacterized protein n=2 Tax=Dactylosporangium fulvum TaxID=53359 RepID=A0ABY5W010_9ACTN|nr:hypothetical protein [Dactylosporangium fulvum]UWP82770.1 hypothetical protein Dfulv_00105 [Dactylosporangium fulvum]